MHAGRSSREGRPALCSELGVLMMGATAGPTSRSYFSQRLRLHYVDWGNPDAPPLLLLHGGRDHCRNWDWVAAALPTTGISSRPTCAGMATASGRRAATTAWPATSTIWRSSSTSRSSRRVTIIAHSLGGNIALRYAGIYPDNVATARRHRRARAVSASSAPSAARSRSMSACATWIARAARARRTAAAPLCLDRGCLQAHAGGEQAPLARAGAGI